MAGRIRPPVPKGGCRQTGLCSFAMCAQTAILFWAKETKTSAYKGQNRRTAEAAGSGKGE